MPQNHDPNDRAFEHFFPEERREDDTDPGMTIAAQPAAYVAPPAPLHQKSLVAPLIAFGVALLGLAVVGFLVINNLTGSGTTRAVAPAPSPSPTPTSSSAPSSSSAPVSSSSPASSDSSTSSSTSSDSPSSTASSSSSSSSASAVLVSLPRSQTACGSPTTYSTTGAVSCGFADSIYTQATSARLADGRSTSFPVTSYKSDGGSGLTYNVSCTHLSGSFIRCTAVSEPDNGLRPEVFVMPTQG